MAGSNSWDYYNPVRIVNASLDEIPKYISGQRILILTSPGFVDRGIFVRLNNILTGRELFLWDSISPNPDIASLDAAYQHARSLDIDHLVALGGGSVIDTGKVLSFLLAQQDIRSLGQVLEIGLEFNSRPSLPLVAVPTTSGTGAEVTPFATIWNNETKTKHSLYGDHVFPQVALLDPELTITLPPAETVHTALDACSHALESLWNRNRSPITMALAVKSLELMVSNLPQVINEPQNVEARKAVQEASLFAGLAISRTRTAVAHAISYPLTSYLSVPHGLACSFTLPHLLKKATPFLVADGIDTRLLNRVTSMLLDLRLDVMIGRYASPGEILGLQHLMVTKGRSENFRYNLPDGLDELLSASLTN